MVYRSRRGNYGPFEGWLSKIAVVASGLFGSISGSAVSNVASTGVITIPLMRQAGYDAKTAGAIEICCLDGRQIMPPIMELPPSLWRNCSNSNTRKSFGGTNSVGALLPRGVRPG